MTEAQYQEILDRLAALEQDVADLKEAYQTLDNPSPSLDGLKLCNCEQKWETLYNQDLPKFTLNGTTLAITLPSAEETEME